MENGILKNTNFGAMYQTRDRRRALFLNLCGSGSYLLAQFNVENYGNILVHRVDGKEINGCSDLDIISEWKNKKMVVSDEMSDSEYLLKAKTAFLELARKMKEDNLISDYVVKPYFGKEPDEDCDTIVKYGNREDRMDYHEWCSINLLNPKDIGEVYKLTLGLMKELQVSFDTGAGCGSVDWELDWSLKRRFRR